MYFLLEILSCKNYHNNNLWEARGVLTALSVSSMLLSDCPILSELLLDNESVCWRRFNKLAAISAALKWPVKTKWDYLSTATATKTTITFIINITWLVLILSKCTHWRHAKVIIIITHTYTVPASGGNSCDADNEATNIDFPDPPVGVVGGNL